MVMKTCALITGGSGFVGSALAHKLLELDFEVILPLRESSSTVNIDDIKDLVHIVRITDQYDGLFACMSDYHPDVVFHLGSLFIAEHKSKDIDSLIDSNIKFGTRVLEAMKENKISYFINTGTSWQNYLSETQTYSPVDLYAATKQAFESVLQYYGEAENIKYTTLRLFDTYGETDRRPKLMNLLFRIGKDHSELDMSPGEQEISLVHVSDVCNAFIQAYRLLKDGKILSGTVFGVPAKKSVSLQQLVSLFEHVSGLKLKINWGKRLYRRREVMKTHDGYEILPEWEPEISLEEGIKKIMAFHR